MLLKKRNRPSGRLELLKVDECHDLLDTVGNDVAVYQLGVNPQLDDGAFGGGQRLLVNRGLKNSRGVRKRHHPVEQRDEGRLPWRMLRRLPYERNQDFLANSIAGLEQ